MSKDFAESSATQTFGTKALEANDQAALLQEKLPGVGEQSQVMLADVTPHS